MHSTDTVETHSFATGILSGVPSYPHSSSTQGITSSASHDSDFHPSDNITADTSSTQSMSSDSPNLSPLTDSPTTDVPPVVSTPPLLTTSQSSPTTDLSDEEYVTSSGDMNQTHMSFQEDVSSQPSTIEPSISSSPLTELENIPAIGGPSSIDISRDVSDQDPFASSQPPTTSESSTHTSDQDYTPSEYVFSPPESHSPSQLTQIPTTEMKEYDPIHLDEVVTEIPIDEVSTDSFQSPQFNPENIPIAPSLDVTGSANHRAP